MALIDALMAGQQFVSGIQQQQQMAREYRDRMAMLARDEERAMRQEERQMMADFRAQEMQDFEIGLARSAEERAVSAEKRAVIDFNRGQEEAKQRIQVNNLEIARLQSEAERAPTIQAQQDALFEIQRITAENEQLAANLKIRVAQGELAAQEAALASQKEFGRVQSALTNVARQVQLDPASLTAEQALAAEQTMYDFIDKNPSQVQALSPYYNAFFKALEQAEGASGSLLTKGGITAKLRREYGIGNTPLSFAMAGTGAGGGMSLMRPMETEDKEGYYSAMESSMKLLRDYENLRDRRQNFLGVIGQPFSNALVGMLPQED
jgi:hypothetical protein